MKNYKIRKYQSTDKFIWDSFVDSAKNGTFLFKRDFMEYHKDRFKDYSLLIFDEKENLTALVPANIKESIIYSHQGLTYGGILIKEDVTFLNYTHIFSRILSFLNEKKIDEIIIKNPPFIYHKSYSEEFQSVLASLNSRILKSETSLYIDINKGLHFTKSKRQSISMSKKKDLVFKEMDSFEEFWNKILIPNLKNKYNTKPVHSLEEITALKKDFPENIKQYNVYSENQIIAGVTIFETEETAHSQYSSGKQEFNKLRGLDFLIDNLLNKQYTNKKYFSFGTSTANEKLQINQGLFTWKQSFGSMPITITTHTIKTNDYKKLVSLFI